MRPSHFLAAAAVTALVASSALAQSLSSDDRTFLQQAAESSLAELQAWRIALGKAQDEDIRHFAQRMVDDHTQVRSQLARLAERKGVALPGEPAIQEQVRLQLLQAAEGARLEQRYEEQFGAKAQQAAIALYQQELQLGKDADVLAFARQVVPQLREHLQMAEDLQASLDRKAAGSTVMGAPR